MSKAQIEANDIYNMYSSEYSSWALKHMCNKYIDDQLKSEVPDKNYWHEVRRYLNNMITID